MRKKIATLTFNPAIDKSSAVEKLIPTQKLRCENPIYFAGGGGINVSRALDALGVSSDAFYFEGGNSGLFFTALIKEKAMRLRPVKCAESTRENVIITEKITGNQYRFGFPGPTICPEEVDKMLNAIAQLNELDYLIISGSLSPGVDIGIFDRIKKITVQYDTKLIVDSSGPALKAAIETGVYLIKPSLSEFMTLTSLDKPQISNVVDSAKKLILEKKCEIIVVSMGGEGAVLIDKKEVIYQSSPKTTVASTVGAGDSMMAGLICKLAADAPLNDVLKYGVACGAAATLMFGTGLCKKDEVERLLANLGTP